MVSWLFLPSFEAAHAGTLLIDDFSTTGPFVITTTINNTPWPITMSRSFPFTILNTETGLANVLAGERGHTVHPRILGPTGSATYNVVTTASPSYLDYHSTADSNAQLDLNYGGSQPVTHGVDFNLPFGGEYYLTLTFQNVTIPTGGSFVIFAGVSQDMGSSGFQGTSFITSVASGAPLVVTMPIPTTSTFGQTAIDGLLISFQPTIGVSFRLNTVAFTTVPEPGSIGLLISGAAGLAETYHEGKGKAIGERA